MDDIRADAADFPAKNETGGQVVEGEIDGELHRRHSMEILAEGFDHHGLAKGAVKDDPVDFEVLAFLEGKRELRQPGAALPAATAGGSALKCGEWELR